MVFVGAPWVLEVRFAYADPPYYAQGKKLYGKHHQEAAVWDAKDEHLKLIARLVLEYPDGYIVTGKQIGRAHV